MEGSSLPDLFWFGVIWELCLVVHLLEMFLACCTLLTPFAAHACKSTVAAQVLI